jgi:hypothetical protein
VHVYMGMCVCFCMCACVRISICLSEGLLNGYNRKHVYSFISKWRSLNTSWPSNQVPGLRASKICQCRDKGDSLAIAVQTV